MNEKSKGKNVEVISTASCGYSTIQSLLLLELDVISWDPDYVILSHNVNDLTAAYFNNFTFDYYTKYSSRMFDQSEFTKRFNITNYLFQFFKTYWFIHDKVKKIFFKPKMYPINRYPYGDNAIDLQAQIFRRNIKTFINIANSNGIKVILGSQPLHESREMFVKHMGYKPYNNQVVYPKHEEFIEHHYSYNSILKECTDGENTYFIDNSILNNINSYFIDFVHYTPEGVKALANNYAENLVEIFDKN